VFWEADGKTDPFYKRFTTDRQCSLILGTSRAAQSLLPEIFNSELNKVDFFNYSFTLGHSPYGPTYLKSIKKKLDHNSHDGVFIIAVDPWSISSKTVDPNDSLGFREVERILGKTSLVNYHPNFEYLINSYNSQYLDILIGGSDKMILHEDGWLEVTVDMDSDKVAERIKNKINNYNNQNLLAYHYSSYRYDYLGKTISYLKNYGKVYLVRLPIHPKMFEIEKLLLNDFDYRMNMLSETHKIPYFNLTNKNSQFQYTDGNHLYKESGKEVSRLISALILESQND
jgi:hypothetical protein